MICLHVVFLEYAEMNLDISVLCEADACKVRARHPHHHIPPASIRTVLVRRENDRFEAVGLGLPELAHLERHGLHVVEVGPSAAENSLALLRLRVLSREESARQRAARDPSRDISVAQGRVVLIDRGAQGVQPAIVQFSEISDLPAERVPVLVIRVLI